MQSLDEILHSILSTSPESRTEHLQTLLRYSQTSPQSLKDSLKRIIQILQITLTDPLVEISLISTNIITSLLVFYKEECMAFVYECLSLIVINLGDSQVCNCYKIIFFLKMKEI